MERTSWCQTSEIVMDLRTMESAARTSAVFFDWTGRTQLTLTGSDRVKFLHGFCTNDVKKLPVGGGCEAFITSIKGRILEHVIIWNDIEAVHVEGTPGYEESLFNHLDRYLITDDVQIARRTGELTELFLTGPRSAEFLTALGDDLKMLPADRHISGGLQGLMVSIRRMDLLQAPGFLLVVPRSAKGQLAELLSQSGAMAGSSELFEMLRIEAGLPLYGVDVTDEHLAQEASRTARCISFTKGCYLGQEPIARLDALGHVNKQLAGVLIAQEGPVVPGLSVRTCDGQEAGVLTSTARKPLTSETVALGMLKSKVAQNGTRVQVETAEGIVEGTVFALPY